jgi:hypothetical protein
LAVLMTLAPAAVLGLYEVFAERLAAMRLSPPATPWDGVFTATQK